MDSLKKRVKVSNIFQENHLEYEENRDRLSYFSLDFREKFFMENPGKLYSFCEQIHFLQTCIEFSSSSICYLRILFPKMKHLISLHSALHYLMEL